MRDTAFTICKALAIILVVVSHAGAPGFVNDFIFQFHVPVFFICAGYFFHEKYLDAPGTYVARRVKGLYWPFLRWSLFFLVIHNLLFPLGLLSEQYGNALGGVLHPYDWRTFCQKAWNITFNMSEYDEFLAGSFWFFRTLFISSIAFLAGLIVVRKLRPADSISKRTVILAGIVLLLIVWKIASGLRIAGIAGGGYRELLGVLFMCAGFLISQYRRYIDMKWPLGLICLAVTLFFAWLCPASMSPKADMVHFFALLLPAVCGFGMLYYLSLQLDRHENVLKKALVYIGERTIYVFAFHLFAFKIVSAVKVGVYGLPWQMVGGHTVVNAYTGDWFWLLYTLVGVGVPLGWVALYRYWSSRADLSVRNCMRCLMAVAVVVGSFLFLCMRKLGLFLWDTVLGIWRAAVDIVSASNPKDE